MTDTQAKPKQQNSEAPAKLEETAMTKAENSTLAQMRIVDNVTLLDAAKAFAGSGFFKDVKSQSQAITKILMGHELGVSPVRAMLGIHAIEIGGVVRLEPGYELRAQLIKQHQRYDYRVRESDWTHCKIEWFELDPNGERFESTGFSEFCVADANKLGLGSRGKWKEDPESMCFAAALRRGCRKYAPDVTFGSADIEDAEAVQIAAEREELPGGDDPIEAELVEEAATQAAPAARQPEPDAAPAAPSAPEPTEGSAAGVSPSPDEGVIYVGLLAVPRAGDGPWRADQEGGGRLRTKEQVAAATKILAKLNLVEGALDPICKSRYGVSLGQVSKVGMDELTAFLEAQTLAVAGKAAADEEPPF